MGSKERFKIERIEREILPEDLKNLVKDIKYLNIKGNKKLLDEERCFGVVGSREISDEGIEFTERLTADLVKDNNVIVSGFMYGVDSVAQKTCVKNGGKTIAVLGTGLEVIYPRENVSLYDEILGGGGLIVSEYEDGFRGERWSFPRRNRLISAIGRRGLIVIEAGIKSGTMSCVNYARKQGREIWVWRGSKKEGNSFLIEEGIGKGFESYKEINLLI